MSEITNVYFYGECEDFYCSISSGQRETAYLMDGKSGDVTDFALLSLNLSEARATTILKLSVLIDGAEEEKEVEINSLSSAYLVDLERALTGKENISIVFEGKTLQLSALSNNFEIDSNKALEIAADQLEEKILLKKKYNNLNAEGYLRILDKNANDFDSVFWCYTVLNIDNESYSIIISTVDGSVLAKSE